jgi:hypothetical protein
MAKARRLLHQRPAGPPARSQDEKMHVPEYVPSADLVTMSVI